MCLDTKIIKKMRFHPSHLTFSFNLGAVTTTMSMNILYVWKIICILSIKNLCFTLCLMLFHVEKYENRKTLLWWALAQCYCYCCFSVNSMVVENLFFCGVILFVMSKSLKLVGMKVHSQDLLAKCMTLS